MMAGLRTLPEDQRQGMMQSQMAVLARQAPADRREVMSAMDAVMGGRQDGHMLYGPPRGMPKLAMATFRQFADRAFPRTRAETGVSLGAVRAAGYGWHLLIGVTFGIAYALLVGQGSWPLAIGWGTVVWLAMMVQMPAMMPMVRFPLWFVIIPFIAHIAMIAPFAAIGLGLITDAAHAHSVLGAVT